MRYRDIARAQIVIDEGKRNKPYRDTVGKLSIGVGRNLDDKGLSDGEIAILLEHDINDALAGQRQIAKPELVDRIVAKVESFETVVGALTGKRQRLEDQISSATTEAELALIVW